MQRWFANSALLLVTFVWGATFTLTKDALQDVSVFSYLAVRFAIATAVLVTLSLLSPITRKSFHARTYGLGIGLGLLLFGAYAFQTLGLQSTSASAAGFLTGLSVVLVPILGLPFLRVIPHPRSWYGAVLALIGLACLCGVDLLDLAAGDMLVILCAFFIAAQMLAIEKYGRKEEPLALATVEVGVLALCCLVMSACRSHEFPALQEWFRPGVVWAVLICAIPGTALAYWAQNVFQKHTTATQTAVIFSTEPVFAAVIAWLAANETLTPLGMSGCLLIFLGMLVADPSLRWKRRRVF